MIEVAEVYALDLDWDLLSHLASPESIGYLRAEQFTVDLIEDPMAKDVFAWQMDHYRLHGSPASASVLEDQFDAISIVQPQTAIGDLIDRLRERYMRNKGRKVAENIAIAVNTTPLEAPKLMLQGGRELADLVVKRGEVFGNGDHWRLMALYDKRASLGQGPSLGYPELDQHFHGMLGITFLIGPPKSMKTWFAVNAIKENILSGRYVYGYSLELPAEEYTQRLRHMVADIPYYKFLKGQYMEEERNLLKEASDFLDASGSFLIEKPQPGNRGVQYMVERALNVGADAIFIDQLQYMENRKGVNLGTANNTGDYWEVCNDLRDYSDEIPIFVVHQFNRSSMKAKEMPEAQQAKGSAAVEEVATLALGLWGSKEMRQNLLVEIGTLVSRNYDLQAWELDIRLSKGCALDMHGLKEPDEVLGV